MNSLLQLTPIRTENGYIGTSIFNCISFFNILKLTGTIINNF